MADTARDPSERKIQPVPPEYLPPKNAPPSPGTVRTPPRDGPRSSTEHDSLASILRGIERLADDLRLRPAAPGYAQRCADLARRLRSILSA